MPIDPSQLQYLLQALRGNIGTNPSPSPPAAPQVPGTPAPNIQPPNVAPSQPGNTTYQNPALLNMLMQNPTS